MSEATSIHFISDDSVQIGGECQLNSLNAWLFAENLSCGSIDSLTTTGKETIASLIFRSDPSLFPTRETHRFLSAIKGNICLQIDLGSGFPSGGGLQWHKLLMGIEELDKPLLAIRWKVDPIPSVIRTLSWKNASRDSLFKMFEELLSWDQSWDRLDLLLSGQKGEGGLLLAQMSGMEEEMALFNQFCPNIDAARQGNQIPHLKAYLKKLGLIASKPIMTTQPFKLPQNDYIWYVGLRHLAYLFIKTPHDVIQNHNPIWKDRLFKNG